MNSDIILFSECGDDQIKKLARECLQGERSIGVVIKERTVAVKKGFNLSDYGTGMYLDHEYFEVDVDTIGSKVSVEEGWTPELGHSELIDVTKLGKFAKTEGAVLQPGFFELWYARELAAKYATDPFDPTLLYGP